MKLPDILVFMSDQHSPYFSGFYGERIVDTPNMNRLVNEGVTFDEAYTVCPICVPSRMSMLSSLRPSRTGIFSNSDTLNNLTPTFLHSLVQKGYETVLVGRMHFIGEDQRHGFTKRIAPDCTTISWVRKKHSKSRGVYESAYGGIKNINLVGGGKSSSSYYDRVVIDKALQYLEEDHDKPQFIVVSVYSPHHPYVGPADLYRKYRERVKVPASWNMNAPYNWRKWQRHETNEGLSIDVQAAYCAMIEELDDRLGEVRKAFDAYCDRNNSKRLFVYLSDHGDMVGDRKNYGKVTFYEKSCKIPMIFAGDGIVNKRIDNAVNIMDFGPTILDYVEAEAMKNVDGVSLYSSLKGEAFNEHVVYAEQLFTDGEMLSEENSYNLMIKEGKYKYFSFSCDGSEYLYDTESDPLEMDNLIDTLPELAKHMRQLYAQYEDEQNAYKTARYNISIRPAMEAYERFADRSYEGELYMDEPPQEYLDYPEIISENCLAGKKAD